MRTAITGAHERDRTADLILTKDVLCQLSYMGDLNCYIRFKLLKPLEWLMERETGFEPATPSLEGLRSSQLSYSRILFRISDCRFQIVNPHSAIINPHFYEVVGRGGFEPP